MLIVTHEYSPRGDNFQWGYVGRFEKQIVIIIISFLKK
jgi:hypothetical protein